MSPMKKPLPVVRGGGFWVLSGHICQELAPFPHEAGGCRGFVGPVPPPLWMRPAMCRETVAILQAPATRRWGRIMVFVTTLEDPFSPRAESAQAPLRSSGAHARRGRHTPD